MSLSPTDTFRLSAHGKYHPHLQEWIANGNWAAIAAWYEEVPVFSDESAEQLMNWMSFAEMEWFYNAGDFQPWFSRFTGKISRTEHLFPVLIFSDAEIRTKAKAMIASVVRLKLAAYPLTVVVSDLFRRDPVALSDLLVCLVSDRILAQQTAYYYFVEFAGVPRYLAIGLSIPPSDLDCQAALG